MKNKIPLLVTSSLLAAMVIPSMVNAGNVKKKYINVSKDGEQAIAADLGTIATSYGQVENLLKATAYDFSYEGHHGVISGNVTSVQGAKGNFGKAVQMDGDGDSITTKGPVLPIGTAGTTAPFTVEYWFKTVGKSTTMYPLTQYRYVSTDSDFYARFAIHHYTDGTIRWWKGSGVSVRTTKNSNDNQWHHIAFARDASQNLMIYLDGVLNVTGKDTQSFINQPLIIGNIDISNGSNGKMGFSGTIDELRIWNKALSKDEIVNSMNSPLSGKLPEGLTAYWTFE